jgi:hypothetical protein
MNFENELFGLNRKTLGANPSGFTLQYSALSSVFVDQLPDHHKQNFFLIFYIKSYYVKGNLRFLFSTLFVFYK